MVRLYVVQKAPLAVLASIVHKWMDAEFRDLTTVAIVDSGAA